MSTAPKPQPVSADPVHVDSKHYTVEAENDRVRVLRVKYGPREKSVMHGHPSVVAVFLTSNTYRAEIGLRRSRHASADFTNALVNEASDIPEIKVFGERRL